MNAPIIPRVRTSVTDEELLALILAQHRELFGEPPPERVAHLFAHLGVEHNAGADTSCPSGSRAGWNTYNFDFGNVRGIAGNAGAFVMTAGEIIEGHEVQVSGRWPAHTTAADGMRAWLELMSTRYARAWDAPDPSAYVFALKGAGYMTASVAVYLPGFLTWVGVYRRTWPERT